MPSETLWSMEDQTLGKHVVLKSYLDGWLPILGRWNDRLLFVDGFAGPGEYESGEPGSPLIALECVKRHKEEGRLEGVEVIMLFIESKPDRARHLENRLEQEQLSSGTKYKILQGTFDERMSSLLDHIEEKCSPAAPAFVMIDPFGVKGISMCLIERILRNAKFECMISFMHESIRRFHKQAEFRDHLNELFGTERWQRCFDMDMASEGKEYLHNLFKKQLKTHGAAQVVFFELWRGNKHIYTICFASGSLKGCDLMKNAFWKADRSGGYRYKGYAGSQGLLFDTDTEPLAAQLQERFGDNATPIEDIEEFVMGDETIFHTGQLRRATLQRLEREGRISVSRPQGGRGFTNDKGIKVRFH